MLTSINELFKWTNVVIIVSLATKVKLRIHFTRGENNSQYSFLNSKEIIMIFIAFQIHQQTKYNVISDYRSLFKLGNLSFIKVQLMKLGSKTAVGI